MATRNSVLVLDGDKPAALDIVRSLGARGLTVHVASSRPEAIAFRSRFAASRAVYPDPRTAPEAFVVWLEESLNRSAVDLVIPVTDVTAIPIAQHAERLLHHAALAVEAPEKLDVVCDKLQTIELARRVGVPAPRTTLVRSAADLDAVEPHFPVVCKPVRSSVWSHGGYEATSVWYAFDEREFRERATKALLTCPILVQEYRTGDGVGIEVLARRGELLHIFQHRRLHELPVTGGGSTYRISEKVDPVLEAHARRLIEALQWTGVAMIEFRVDPATGAAALMEINGRFWGSLPLATRAGVPFASALYDMLVLDRVAPAPAYGIGVRCRRLADDLDWFKEMATLGAADREVLEGLVERKSAGQLLREFARVLSPREYFDLQMWRDPIPGLVDLLRIVRAQAAMVWRHTTRAARRVWSVAHRARFRGPAARQTARAQRVLFVCYGNIMRSAFAAAYFARRAQGQPVEIISAGHYPHAGRLADPRMLEAARAYGVDLSTHRSRVVDAEMAAWADVIFVMDRRNRDALRRFPGAESKIQFLGMFEYGATDIEIGDPYGSRPGATVAVCRRIARAIDGLLEHSRRSSSSAPLSTTQEAAR